MLYSSLMSTMRMKNLIYYYKFISEIENCLILCNLFLNLLLIICNDSNIIPDFTTFMSVSIILSYNCLILIQVLNSN